MRSDRKKNRDKTRGDRRRNRLLWKDKRKDSDWKQKERNPLFSQMRSVGRKLINHPELSGHSRVLPDQEGLKLKLMLVTRRYSLKQKV